MSNVPTRRLLTEAIREMLETVTTRPVAVSDAPRDSDGLAVATPYAVIHPTRPMGRGTEAFWGPMDYPEADAKFAYIIHSVGARPDQAEWMADSVRTAFIGRDADSTYTNDLTVSGLTIMLREAEDSSGLMRNESNIFLVVDTYLVSVTTS